MESSSKRMERAVEEDHVDLVRALLAEGAEANMQLSIIDGSTALHLAAKYGYVDMVQVLLSEGSRVNEKDRFGRTALHSSASNGPANYAVQALLAAGAIFLKSKSGHAYERRLDHSESRSER